MILTSCAVSPEHLTARCLIALNAHASTPCLTLCMQGNFSCFSWRLLAFLQNKPFYVIIKKGRLKDMDGELYYETHRLHSIILVKRNFNAALRVNVNLLKFFVKI